MRNYGTRVNVFFVVSITIGVSISLYMYTIKVTEIVRISTAGNLALGLCAMPA